MVHVGGSLIHNNCSNILSSLCPLCFYLENIQTLNIAKHLVHFYEMLNDFDHFFLRMASPKSASIEIHFI